MTAAIRDAKALGKAIKKFVGTGLYLLAKPTGAAAWRLKFSLNGTEKLISLGRYPDVSLAEARERREKERKLVAAGINPTVKRRAERVKRSDTFQHMANEWLRRQSGLSQGTLTRHGRRLARFIHPFIGSKAIDSITVQDLLAVLRKVEAHGKFDTAKRLRELCSSIWRHAVHEGKAQFDVAANLKGVIQTVRQRSHAAVTDSRKHGELLRAMWGYQGCPLTIGALRLSAILFVRPGELRHMEWKELDLNAGTWRIPSEKMKMRDAFVVPLGLQAVEVLRSLEAHSGDDVYVFPSVRRDGRPMSENTVNAALRALGYSGDQHVAHGFRATASTLLNEQGYDPDVIELCLAHNPRGVRAVYNRAAQMEDRKSLMQKWADEFIAPSTTWAPRRAKPPPRTRQPPPSSSP